MNKLFSIFVFGLLLTISIATISIAQADDESSGLVATFGTNGGLTDGSLCNLLDGSNTIACGLGAPVNHNYSDLVASKPLTAMFTNPLSLFPPTQGYFDAVEPDFQDTGAFPGIDGTISPLDSSGASIFPGPPSADFNFVRGYEEGEFTFSGLCVGCFYTVTVIISDMDFFDTYASPGATDPLVETVFVTGNSADLGTVAALPLTPVGPGNPGDSQTITTTLAIPGIADGSGTLTIGFNENFVWAVSPSFWDFPDLGICTTDEQAIPGTTIGTQCRGEEPGVRVEQISLELMPDVPVGGTFIPIDQTALLLAGVQSISMWMIPVVIAGIGIGVFVIKRRK